MARSLSVAPGDKVKAEVFAKYVDPTSANWTGVLTTLMSNIQSGASGTVLDGEGYGTTLGSTIPFAGVLSHGSQSGNAPKAYLNWVVFDNRFNFLTGGFKRMTESAKESGSDVAHELLTMDEITITEPGFVYIYLSNENGTPIEVYFDDFKVTHTKTNVIQYNEYYAHGLQNQNSWTRENNSNNFLYNAANELNGNTGWYETFFRGYDPAIGRFLQIDPLSVSEQATYQYAGNNPIMFNDPMGSYKAIANENSIGFQLDMIRAHNRLADFHNSFTLGWSSSYHDIEGFDGGGSGLEQAAAVFRNANRIERVWRKSSRVGKARERDLCRSLTRVWHAPGASLPALAKRVSETCADH